MPARPPHADVAALLVEARARMGSPGDEFSQEDAAHAIGVSVTTYGRWERGERRPKGSYAKAVAKALKVDEAQLAAPEEPRRPVPPDLEEVFYEMTDRMGKLERMVGLLLTARAADFGVPVAVDPGAAFAEAFEEGLLEDLPPADPDDQTAVPGPKRRARAQGSQPSATGAAAAAAGRRR